MADEFFKRLQDWSAMKHRILEKYLRVWVSKLSSRHPLLVFVDGCAGAGTYQSGEVGSPVIAARFNDSFLRERKKRLLVLAFEDDDEVSPLLRASLAPWCERNPPEAAVFDEPFASRLEEVVNWTRNVPVLFFIDPYGTNGIRAKDLQPVLNAATRDRTEVMLRIDPGLLARQGGWLARHDDPEPKKAKTAASFADGLRQFNTSEETIRILSSAPDEIRGFIKQILLEEYLGLFAGFRYQKLIDIRETYYAAPKYYLLHVTNSPDGATKINDVVSTTEDALFVTAQERKDAGQISMFGPAQRVPRVSMSEACSASLRIIQEKPGRFMIDVSADLAMLFGPDLRSKDHMRAVRELKGQGRVRFDPPLQERTRVRPT